MGLFTRRDFAGATADDLLSRRQAGRTASTTPETALRHSAVWACLRLRADLISTLPVDVFRRVQGWQVEQTKPPVLVNPGGDRVDITEWLYSSQFDLDRYGNCFGVISERDGAGHPARIDLVSASDVSVQVRKGELAGYRIKGTEYGPDDVWHEKQYTAAGLHVGLAPIAYAAWSIGGYLSAQDFVLNWFNSGAVPSGRLKNTKQVVPPKEAAAIKERFKASVQNGDVFVYGSDWDYDMVAVPANQTAFLEEMKYGVSDVCRFFGVPGDMIDAESSTGAITYANVTQRNLQLLVVNLGPPIVRREHALSSLTAGPRYVKLNTDALLRMDPAGRADTMSKLIGSRLRAPDEMRELDNLPPLTDEQIAQMLLLDPPKYPKPITPEAEPVIPPGQMPMEPT